MVGGAVVTKEFADEIGANGYAGDAIEAVRLAQVLEIRGDISRLLTIRINIYKDYLHHPFDFASDF